MCELYYMFHNISVLTNTYWKFIDLVTLTMTFKLKIASSYCVTIEYNSSHYISFTKSDL